MTDQVLPLAAADVELTSGRRTRFNKVRIFAHDRRLTAIHESGHLVVGKWAGLKELGAWIGGVETDPLRNKTWTGSTAWRGGIERLSNRRRTMVAVAGAVAEKIWIGRFEEDREDYIDVEEIGEELSPSDWELVASENLFEDAVRRTTTLLSSPLWTEVLGVARTLMRNGFYAPPAMSERKRRDWEIRLKFYRLERTGEPIVLDLTAFGIRAELRRD